MASERLLEACQEQLRERGVARSKGMQYYLISYLVETGDVATTSSFDLERTMGIKYIIHALGPVWRGVPWVDGYSYYTILQGLTHEESKLDECICNVLREAFERLDCTSVSVPAISSGVFAFPKEKCADQFMRTILHFADRHGGGRQLAINLTNLDEPTTVIFEAALRNHFA